MSTNLYLPQRMGYLRKSWPGMNPAEVVVFNNWLLNHFNEYSEMDFNVRVGNGSDPLPNFTDAERQQWLLNTQKRIDCLAWKDLQPTIIEVKRRAELKSVGQVVGYKHLWMLENPTAPEPSCLLVYNRTDSDVMLVANAANVRFEQVDADFSGLSKAAASNSF